jgi:glycosyltransferase involved in cell wall biosynthesis
MIDYKISIITICFNEINTIEQTILSVINQTYPNIEYIVIDGKSEDGTYDAILKYKNHINTLIHEKDFGIFNAMNKGIKVSKGDYILFMNAGDYFYDSYAVQNLMKYANNINEVIYGSTKFVHKDGRKIIRKPKKKLEFTFGMPFCHQSCAINRNCVISNIFVENGTIYADYIQLSKIRKTNAIFTDSNSVISVYDCSGVSSIPSIRNLKDLTRSVYGEWGLLKSIYCFIFLSIRWLKNILYPQ